MNMIFGSSANPQRQDVNNALGEFTASLIWGDERRFDKFVSLGVVDDGAVIAAMIYHNWDPHAGVIEISGASTSARWLTKPVLWKMFSMPFLEFGCQMVLMRVSPDNRMANGRGLVRLLRAYGFKEHRIPRLGGRHEDQIIFTLTDTDWKANGFHKELDDGQAISTRAA